MSQERHIKKMLVSMVSNTPTHRIYMSSIKLLGFKGETMDFVNEVVFFLDSDIYNGRISRIFASDGIIKGNWYVCPSIVFPNDCETLRGVFLRTSVNPPEQTDLSISDVNIFFFDIDIANFTQSECVEYLPLYLHLKELASKAGHFD